MIYKRITGRKDFELYRSVFSKMLQKQEDRIKENEPISIVFESTLLSIFNPDFYYYIILDDDNIPVGFFLGNLNRGVLEKIFIMDHLYAPGNGKESMRYFVDLAINEGADRIISFTPRNWKAYKRMINHAGIQEVSIKFAMFISVPDKNKEK